MNKLIFLCLLFPVFAIAQNCTDSFDTKYIETCKSAEAGDAKAQRSLGFAYATGKGVKQNNQAAVQWYQKAAEQGDAKAQYNLGVAYATGQGVRQDNRTAVEWYRKAADQGDAEAQYNLGVAYANGQGVRQNKSMAKEFFGKACDGGMQDGCDSYKKLNEEGVQ